MSQINDNLVILGNLLVQGSMPKVDRSALVQDDNAVYPIPLTSFRVQNALQTNLPGAGSGSDLGLVSGTFGAASPSLQTGDVKTTTISRMARCEYPLPPEYVAGQSVSIRLHSGMLTTLSDGAATADVEVYRCDREAGVGADLCTTAAQSIKNLTLTDKTFNINSGGLSPGDTLDIRVTIAIVDAATGTAVIGIIGEAALLLDIKG